MTRLSLLVALVLVACGTDRVPPGSGGSHDGEALFRETCGMCHGMDGAGGPDGPQILNPVRDYATYVVRNGRAMELGYMLAMEALTPAELSDAELSAILDFLSAAPHPTTGAALYTRFCGNCHGADATGGRVEEAVAGADADEIDEKVREGHHDGRFAERTEYMPGWGTSELTVAEVDQIAAFLATLPEPPDDDEDDDSDEGVDER